MSIKTTLIQASPEYLSELIVSGIREELQKFNLTVTKMIELNC